MNLNFSIFRKLLDSSLAQIIASLLALCFLIVQAYNLTPVAEGGQMIAVSIFNHAIKMPWWLVFLFDITCVLGTLFITLRINSSHRFVYGMSFPITIFTFVGITSLPQVMLHPEGLFSAFLSVLVIYYILQIYNQANISDIVFRSAVICSVSSLFYFPSIIFAVLIIVGISIFRPFSLRSFFLIFIGLALLYFYLYSLSYIFNWDLNFNLNQYSIDSQSIFTLPKNLNFGLLGVFVLGIISVLRLYSMRQKLIVRQRNQLVIVFIACCIYFVLGLVFDFSNTGLVLFSLASIFFLFLYQNIDKKWIIEFALLTILIYNSFVTFFS